MICEHQLANRNSESFTNPSLNHTSISLKQLQTCSNWQKYKNLMHQPSMGKWFNLVEYNKNFIYHYFSSELNITEFMVLYSIGNEIKKCGLNRSQLGFFGHKGVQREDLIFKIFK